MSWYHHLMSEKKDQISDLPTYRELSNALPVVKVGRGLADLALKTGFGGANARKIVEAADELLAEFDILSLPDRFNAAFAERGWIATSSMSVEVMRLALEKHEKGEVNAAGEIILGWLTPQVIESFAINRSKSFSDVRGRWHQLREALALTEEGRYWSAVPLIMIACDGFASDVLGTSPFEKSADLTLFDSMVAHPSSLPALIGQITKGVRKSSDETLSLPVRHGILHGRSLGYANRVVCLKAWMLMIALVDWASDKRDEEKRRAKEEERRKANWHDNLALLRKNRADKQAIGAFTHRRWEGQFDGQLPENEPPFAFNEFLTGWKIGNFGIMAKRVQNLTKHKHGHIAGRMRSHTELIKLNTFEIQLVEQTTVARAEAHVRMSGQTHKGDGVGGDFHILAFRHTADGGIAMPTDEGGWYVQERCIFDLLHERTVGTREK